MEPPSGLVALVASLSMGGLLAAAAAGLRASTREERDRYSSGAGEAGAWTGVFRAWARDRSFTYSVLQLGQGVAALGSAVASAQLAQAWAARADMAPAAAAATGLGLAALSVVSVAYVLPRVVAAWRPTACFPLVRLVAPLYLLLEPTQRLIDAASRLMVLRLRGDLQRLDRPLLADDLDALLRDGGGLTEIAADERELLESIVEFRDARVRDVMIPRTDTVFVEVGASLEEVLETVARERYSRYPVYRDTVDCIVGTFSVKDAIPLIRDTSEAAFRLEDLLRPAVFVPESKRISELLRELQVRKVHLAVVVDEFGGTSGIVALEDLIEVVFGDIYDEYDEEGDEPGVERQPDGTLRVDARLPIREIEDELGIQFPSDAPYDTLAGFVVTTASAVPEVGYRCEYEGWRFTVLDADMARVRVVGVEPGRSGDGEDDAGGASDMARQAS